MGLSVENTKRVSEIVYEQAKLQREIETTMTAANEATKVLRTQLGTLQAELFAIQEEPKS